MRTERHIADWQCNRCGNIGQTTVAVLTDGGPIEPVLQQYLPSGWLHVEIHWNQGAVLSQDLCATCAEKIDGFMQRKYDVVDPERDVEVQEKPVLSNSHPPTKKTPRKRAAKKAVKQDG